MTVEEVRQAIANRDEAEMTRLMFRSLEQDNTEEVNQLMHTMAEEIFASPEDVQQFWHALVGTLPPATLHPTAWSWLMMRRIIRSKTQ